MDNNILELRGLGDGFIESIGRQRPEFAAQDNGENDGKKTRAIFNSVHT